MKPNNAIEVQGISKNYKLFRSPIGRIKEFLHPNNKKFHNTFCALNDVSFEVEKGTTFGIVGQNGSGKSTLLQIISGIIKPTSGNVEVQGKISALLELGAGFHREFTGCENVYLQGTIMGISRGEMDKHFHLIEEFADIGNFIEQPVKTYSSGMYVRLAFAVAINIDPDILIIDEVLAVGDDMFRRKCFRKIEEFREMGKTILFVSHNLGTVTSICNKAILIDKGKMVDIGKPKEIANIYGKLLYSREEKFLKHLSGKNKQTSNTKDENIEKTDSTSNSEYRYGAGGANLVDINIVNKDGQSVNVINLGELFTIRITAKLKKQMYEPRIGYNIRTLNGVEVSGTNTFLRNADIHEANSGTVLQIDFQQKMNLNPGSYTLSTGIAEGRTGELIFHDRRLDIIAFKVIGNASSIGLVDMSSTVEIKTIE